MIALELKKVKQRSAVTMKNLTIVWILLLTAALFQVCLSRKHEHHHHREHHHRSRNRGFLREYNHRYHHANNEYGKRERDLDDSIDNSRHSTRHGSVPFTAEKNGNRRIVEIDIEGETTGRGKLSVNSAPLVQKHPIAINATRTYSSTARPFTTSTTKMPDITIPCASSKDCKSGSCCQNRNGKERVCMELNVPSGKQCWNYCMCSKGLVCFYKQGTEVEEKDKTGICKIPQEDDLSQGNYMKP